MDNSLGILIAGKLDQNRTIAQINRDLKEIASRLENLQLNIDFGKATEQIKEFNRNAEKFLGQSSRSAGNIGEQLTQSMSIDIDKLRKNNAAVFAEIDRLRRKYGGDLQSVRIFSHLDEDEEQLRRVTVALKDLDGIVRQFEIEDLDGKGITTTALTETADIEKSRKEMERLFEARQKIVSQLEQMRYLNQIAPDDYDAMIRLVDDSDLKQLSTLRETISYLKADYQELTKIQADNAKKQESYEKQWAQAEKNTEILRKRLEIEQRQAEIRAQDVRRRYGPVITPEQNRQLDNYVQSMKSLTATTPDVEHKIRKLNTEFKGITSNVLEAGSKVDGFGKQLEVALTRIPIWMIGMTAFYAPLRGFQRAIDHIVMLDTQMVELRRVMDAAPQTYNQLMERSISLSSELGNKIEDVNQAMVEFARQGYEPETLIDLTETATVASNISELSTTEAMSSLTAAMTAFNIEASDSIMILDRLNEVDNNFAISTANISEALEKSAATATTFGVSIDELIGLISAIGITTRESGSVIGNSLKTILSRLTTMEPSINALAEIGINVKDASGEMRSSYDILEELAGKWNSLTSEQQQNLAVTLAGRYQLSRFLVLMQQWGTVTEVAETSMNSAGSAMREQEEYAKSLEARLNRLSNSGVELSQALGDAFLTDGIVAFAEFTARLASLGSDVISSIGALPPIFGALTTALAVVSTRFRTAMIDMNMFKRSADGLTVSLGGLTRGLRTLAASTAIGVVFAGIGYALEKLINKIGETYAAREEALKIHESSLESLKNESDEIHRLASEYEELSNIDRGIEEEERYIQLQNELAQLLPSVVAYEDEKGNKILQNSDFIREHISLLEEQLKFERELAAKGAESTVEVNLDSIEAAEKRIESLRGAMETYQEHMAEAVEKGDMDRAKKWHREINEINAEIQEEKDAIAEAFGEIVEAYKAVIYQISAEGDLGLQDAEVSWLANIAKDAEFNISQLDELALKVAQIKSLLGEDVDLTGLNVEQIGIMEALAQAVQYGSVEWDKYRNILINTGMDTQYVNQMLGNLKATEDEVSQARVKHNEQNKEAVPIFNDMLEIVGFTTDAYDDLAEVTEDLADKTDQLFESYEEAISKIKDLNGILDELNEGHGLSADSISLLMEKYNELLPYLNDEVALRNAIMDAIEEEEEVAINALVSKLAAQIDMLDESVVNNTEFYNWLKEVYQGDIEDFENLAQAKLAVETQLIDEMSRKWGKYYDAHAQTLTAMGREFMNMDTSGMDIAEREMYELSLAQISNEMYEFERRMSESSSKFKEIVGDVTGIDFGSISDSIREVGSEAEKAKRKGDRANKTAKASEAQLRKSTFVANEYEKALAKVNTQLEKLNSEKNSYAKHSREYRKALEQEIKLLEKQYDLMQAQADSLKDQIRRGDINQYGIITSTTSVPLPTSSTSGGSNAEVIWNFLKSKGFTDNQAAGIMGNLMLESGLNPKAVNKSSGAFGIAQWLGSRKTALRNYARRTGGNMNDLVTQLNFLWHELTTSEKRTLNWLRSNPKASASQVAAAFDRLFERSEGTHVPQRQRYANQFLNRFSGRGSGSGSSSADLTRAMIDAESEASRLEAERQQAVWRAELDLLNMQVEMQRIADRIQDVYFEIIESHLLEFDRRQEEFTKDLARISYRQSYYGEDTKKWIQLEVEREKILRKQRDIQTEEIKFIKNQIKHNKNLNAAQKARLDDELLKRTNELWQMEEDILNLRIQMAERTIDAYKRALEAQRDASVKAIDKLIEEIDKSVAEADFNKRLRDQQKEREEILAQIDQLSLDTSDAARARLKELNESLQEIDEAIEEMQRDRQIELRKESLRQEQEDINQYYTDLINDEKHLAKMRSDIIKGSVKNIKKELDKFYKDISGMGDLLGKSFVNNLLDSIKNASFYLDSTGKYKIASFRSGGYTGNFTGDRLAVLHEKELVLNKHDTSNLLNAVDIVRDLFRQFKMPQTPSLKLATGTGGVTNEYNLTLNVDNLNGTKRDAQFILEEAVRGFEKLGGNFGG